MVVVSCYKEGCEFATADVPEAVAAAFITHHLAAVHPPVAVPKAPVIECPKITQGVLLDGWNVFVREWGVYCKTANVPRGSSTVYLLNCCDSELRANLHKEDPDISSREEAAVLTAIKKLAVVSVATCVLQTELLSLHQDH